MHDTSRAGDTPPSCLLSTLRGSAAPGFLASRNEPESERSPESATAALFSAPADSHNGTSRPESAPYGTHAARSPGSENTKRFTALSEYDLKGQATVNFNTGSSKVSAKDQEQLKALAQTATALTGYIVEVTGYADSTGSAAMNTQLSEDRAKAVIAFLMQQGNVPIRHIVAPGAMGEYGPAATNETKAGRAENRRVEVKVLVNKGIAGS